jgi:hypothetical protein
MDGSRLVNSLIITAGRLLAARDVIVHHIDDRITLRLARDASADFKVQDGLVFDAVRDGDQVEITVENIDGAKTIVGLKEE